LDDETTRRAQEEPAAGLERDGLSESGTTPTDVTGSSFYQQAKSPLPKPIVTIESDTRGYWTSSELDDGDGS
jgi:hypothetical protein